MEGIHFRPHHFLCTLCFQGRGYSPAFTANFYAIIAALNDDEACITITNTTDSICGPCPSRCGDACNTEEKITVLDHAHAAALEIVSSQQLTWGEAKKIIKEKITLEKFHHICATCSWKEQGICEKVLTEFLSGPSDAV